MRIAVSASLAVLLLASATPSAQPNDLDRLMEQVLARRDENWKKLQQYLLDERETFDLSGPGGARLYGFRRDYSWFMQEGIFVRSPVRADGVTLSESARRKAEADWIRHERRREQRRVERAKEAAASAADPSAPAAVQPDSPSPFASSAAQPDPPAPVASSESAPDLPAPSAALVSAEPAFVSYAYFLRFRFEPNHYALVGRESLDGRAVLRIEYYPSELFREGRTRPNRRVRDRDEEIEDKMNKVSLVTLWVDPEAHQILQYTFDDIDMDFFPGRSLVRIDDLKATMQMGQPFPNIWLPNSIEMHFGMMLAVGAVDATYRVDYQNYKEAAVTYKIK